MSLSVGIVSIEYQDYPGDLPCQFLEALTEDPNPGLDPDKVHTDYWYGGGNENSVFYEFTKAALLRRVRGYAAVNNLTLTDRRALYDYVNNLPFRRQSEVELITLHLTA